MPTNPTQMRLSPETLADLEAIRQWLAATSRTDAVRYAAAEIRRQMEAGKLRPKKVREKSP